MEQDERELILRSQQGDQAAFEMLVSRYDRRLMGLIRSMVRNGEDARDVYQDVFLRAWLGLPNFRLEAGFFTWLYRIAVNRCMTYFDQRGRREKKHLQPLLDDEEDGDWMDRVVAHQSVNPIEDQQETLGRDLMLKKIWTAVETLKPKQRLIFCLRHQHGLRVKEIAEIFDMPEGTVKILAFRAVRAIRDQLKDDLA